MLTIQQNQDQSNLSVLMNTMTGLTINGQLNSTTISATTISAVTIISPTISATTYQNLPTTIITTGGTASNAAKTYTFTNNTGGTFTVTGLTDLVVTGGTYSNGTTTFTNSTGGTFTVTGFSTGGTSFVGGTVTGATNFTGGLTGNTFSANTLTATSITSPTISATTFSAKTITSPTISATTLTAITITSPTISATTFRAKTITSPTISATTISGVTIISPTISATTYQNLPIDIRVTGGTYSNGSLVLTNNSGGTVTVNGFSTGGSFTGGTVTGATTFSGGLTATTFSATTYQGLPPLQSIPANSAFANTGVTSNPPNGSIIYSSTGGTNNLISRDNNGNAFTNNFESATLGLTATGTYNLSGGTARYILMTGGTGSATLVLPNATTLQTGQVFEINNNATGNIIVSANTGNSLFYIPSGGYSLTLLLTNNTTAGTWDYHFLTPNTTTFGLSGLTINGAVSATTYYLQGPVYDC